MSSRADNLKSGALWCKKNESSLTVFMLYRFIQSKMQIMTQTTVSWDSVFMGWICKWEDIYVSHSVWLCSAVKTWNPVNVLLHFAPQRRTVYLFWRRRLWTPPTSRRPSRPFWQVGPLLVTPAFTPQTGSHIEEVIHRFQVVLWAWWQWEGELLLPGRDFWRGSR